MRLAFVSIPQFSCAVEIRRKPLLASRPLIIGDSEQPKRVFDCSLDAGKRGVHPEMVIRKALALCPNALVIPPDPVLYGSSWERILAALGDVSPEVEDEALGRSYLNVTGLGPHHGNEHQIAQYIVEAVYEASGLTASIGIANGKLPAFAAANMAPEGEGYVVRAGDEAALLAGQPVDMLPVDSGVISRLRLLGLKRIADVARLSVPELQSQFGFDGKRIWQLANAIDETPLLPRPVREILAASFSFEEPIGGIDIMIAVARQLLSRLQLGLRGRAARELTLQAELISGRGWEHRIVLREAVSEVNRLDFVLRTALQNAPPPNAIKDLSLRLGGLTGETGQQMTLGEKGRLQRQLEEAIRQLKARYGYSPIYRCLDVESWSAVPEERQILVESDT